METEKKKVVLSSGYTLKTFKDLTSIPKQSARPVYLTFMVFVTLLDQKTYVQGIFTKGLVQVKLFQSDF